MEALQADDDVRLRLHFSRDRPAGSPPSQRILPRQVLQELQPIAGKLHMSSEAFLTIVSIAITLCTIGFVFAIHVFHKRRHRRQQQHAKRILAARDQGTIGVEPDDTKSLSTALRPPEESYTVRVGRRSWSGRTRGGLGAARFDEHTDVLRSWSPHNALASGSQTDHPLRTGYTRSISGRHSSGTPSPTGSRKGKERETDHPPYPQAFTPTLTITDDGEFSHHAKRGAGEGSPDDYEDERYDLFDDYYNDDTRLSLASYYRISTAGSNNRQTLLSPITMDGRARHRHQVESTFSIGGLVDMYVESPTMGMGSPRSPGLRFSQLPTARFSHGLLRTSGLVSKTTWRQPTITVASLSAAQSASTLYPFAFNFATSGSSPISSSDSAPNELTNPSAMYRHPQHQPSFPHDREEVLGPAIPPVTPPLMPPYLPPQQRRLLPTSFPPPSAPMRYTPIPIIIPSVPPRMPINGSDTPVRRRVRGMSIHGEIMRMTAR